MKLPRFTVRRAMLLIALIALGCFVASELRDGMPPQFVVRGIPERIARLKPGMSWQEAHDILGLETPWWRGGTSASPGMMEGNGHYMHETYTVLPERIVAGMAKVSGVTYPVRILQSKGRIHLRFDSDPEAVLRGWRSDKATRLSRASFSSDWQTIAEMPSR